jgi:hypothetical protein
MWYIHNEVLLSHKEEWNYTIFKKMDGIGGYHVKWSKTDSERQKPHVFTDMCKIDPKNIYTKTNMIIYIFICRTCL